MFVLVSGQERVSSVLTSTSLMASEETLVVMTTDCGAGDKISGGGVGSVDTGLGRDWPA